MIFTVIPIAKTEINWTLFLKLGEEALRRNLASGLDAKNIQTKDMSAYVACLGNLVSGSFKDPIVILRNAGSLLRHASISFFVVGDFDVIHEVAIEGRVAIAESTDYSSSYHCAVVSGSLEQWRDSIINGSSSHTTKSLRNFYNRILDEMDKMNLRQLFEEYSRRYERDGTYMLVQK